METICKKLKRFAGRCRFVFVKPRKCPDCGERLGSARVQTTRDGREVWIPGFACPACRTVWILEADKPT